MGGGGSRRQLIAFYICNFAVYIWQFTSVNCTRGHTPAPLHPPRPRTARQPLRSTAADTAPTAGAGDRGAGRGEANPLEGGAPRPTGDCIPLAGRGRGRRPRGPASGAGAGRGQHTQSQKGGFIMIGHERALPVIRIAV